MMMSHVLGISLHGWESGAHLHAASQASQQLHHSQHKEDVGWEVLDGQLLYGAVGRKGVHPANAPTP